MRSIQDVPKNSSLKESSKDQCWFCGSCAKSPCLGLNSCIKWLEIKTLVDYARLPIRYNCPEKLKLDPDIEVPQDIINLFNSIKSEIDSGNNFYIYSSLCRTGKTFWACRLILNYILQVWAGNAFRPRAVFVHVPTYLETKNANRFTKDTDELDDLIDKCDLVVWDDIGATKMTEYEKSVLLVKIDNRLNRQQSNIYTSNLYSEPLLENVEARLATRIWNESTLINLDV